MKMQAFALAEKCGCFGSSGSICDSDPRAHHMIPQVKEAKLAILEQLQEEKEDVERLTLTAPVAGTVGTPPMKSPEMASKPPA